jgi:hypothetical protein
MNDNFTYKINLRRVEDQYYIDRLGHIHKYDGNLYDEIHSMHFEIAKKHYPNHDRPQDVLNKLGWITIGSTTYHKPIIFKKPTQAQINKLAKLNHLNNLLILDNGYFVNYNNKYL